MNLTAGIKLEAVLASAANTTQPKAHVGFVTYGQEDIYRRPDLQRTALNDTTDVTILTAPEVGEVKQVTFLSIHNASADTETVTIKTDDGTTEMVWNSKSLTTGQVLSWSPDGGWIVS